jgi:hypothetical protein
MPTLAKPRIPAAISNIELALRPRRMLQICTVRFVGDRPRHFAHRFRAASQEAARSGRLTHDLPALRFSGLSGPSQPTDQTGTSGP